MNASKYICSIILRVFPRKIEIASQFERDPFPRAKHQEQNSGKQSGTMSTWCRTVLVPEFNVFEHLLGMSVLILTTVATSPEFAGTSTSFEFSRSFSTEHVLPVTRDIRNARMMFRYFLITRRNFFRIFRDRFLVAVCSDSVENELSKRAKKRFSIWKKNTRKVRGDVSRSDSFVLDVNQAAAATDYNSNLFRGLHIQ